MPQGQNIRKWQKRRQWFGRQPMIWIFGVYTQLSSCFIHINPGMTSSLPHNYDLIIDLWPPDPPWPAIFPWRWFGGWKTYLGIPSLLSGIVTDLLERFHMTNDDGIPVISTETNSDINSHTYLVHLSGNVIQTPKFNNTMLLVADMYGSVHLLKPLLSVPSFDRIHHKP